VQVVYRNAQLSVEEIKLDPTCDVLKQMKAQMAPQLQRMDLRSAPLMRLQVAQGEGSQWYALLQMHHLTTDHVAQEILVEEVLVHLRGRTEHLSIPVSFRAFVAQALNRTQDSEANAFFQRKLGDVTESTTPFGLVDVHGDGSQIEQVRQLVEARLCERVRHVARALNMSPAPLFHAVWALVVARTSGRDDVVFGTVLSGRLQGIAGADRALGMFINTLPLRLQMKGATARAVVQQTQRELVELLKYEQASLAQAQRCSGIEEAAPLFSAMLNYRHSAPVRSAEADSEDPASSIGVLANQPRTNYPIALFVDDLGVQFRLVVQVDRRIDAHRVLGYVYTALEGLVEAMESAPERAFLDLPVLPTTERHQVIEAFNATHAAYPRDMLIHELFEAQVEKTPDAVAALYKDQQLRYTELNGRANQLARYLRAYGIGPDQLVGICVERSLELVVGIWGVLKAGGAYVPLDPSYPAERLGYLLKDASPRMVLTQARFKPALAGSALPILTLEEQWDEIAQQSTANLDLRAEGLNAHHLAYVIYTSGSTGEPKGVMVEHRNLVNYAIHATRQFDVASGAGSLICTSLGFDLALTGFYPPLLCGRAVRLSAEQQDLSALSRLVGESENLAPLKLTPSHLGLLEGSLSSGQLKGRVRVLVLGGEALRAEVVRAWREHAPETRIFNHYGPTETTVGCVVHEIADELSGVIPIGRPISNTQIYILDEQRQPVPIWVVGEIYIGGAGVARGYLNRWQLTEQRFIADPFSAEPDAKIYKSGDLGRWRADGTIEYMGRNDRQVKFRGYRIELGEIEAQLIRHALVKEAVVLAREDIPGEKQLVAYVTSHETPPSIEELRAHVKGILPEYMLPSAYVLLESLPLTANGKLDRRALPMPEGEAYALKPYEAPQGEIEELLAGIWCELLRIERVGRHDNFFELGGHSLLAVQLLTRIRQSLGRELALRELFEFPSVQAQAQRLSTAEQVSQRPIERVDRNPLPALSLSERRLWLIDKLLDQLESAGEGVLAEKISAMSDDEVSDLLREAKDI